MAFHLFEQSVVSGRTVIRPTGSKFSLAGCNLIYKAWLAHGRPLDNGWRITADELIQILTDRAHNCTTRRLVIDFDPKATWRIGILELLDVYAFTWSDGNGAPSWTPIMLRLRDIFYKEYNPPIGQAGKSAVLSELPEPEPNCPDFVEFLYLNGPSYGWTWGKNGMTNAAFLQGRARDYFRQFF